MMGQVVLEFGIGFVIGAVVCLGKEFLLQRFILTGNKFLSMLLFWLRYLIDFAVLVGMFFISVAAMVGAAAGLSIYLVILVYKTLKEEQQS